MEDCSARVAAGFPADNENPLASKSNTPNSSARKRSTPEWGVIVPRRKIVKGRQRAEDKTSKGNIITLVWKMVFARELYCVLRSGKSQVQKIAGDTGRQSVNL